jgi:hypothetical protein
MEPTTERNDAMRGLATGNRAGKPAEREQTIYTPQCILDVCTQVWPDGIALDPCCGPGSIVPAHNNYGPAQDGLTLNWAPRTYVNPPYGTLDKWLAKALREPAEQIILCPVRTNRPWWVDAMCRMDAIAWLNPLTFCGFKSAFPAPLVLAYRGERIGEFGCAAMTATIPGKRRNKPLATLVTPGMMELP